MSAFRGSRRLMARIAQKRPAQQANRAAARVRRLPAERRLRHRLNREATVGFVQGSSGLRKGPVGEA